MKATGRSFCGQESLNTRLNTTNFNEGPSRTKGGPQRGNGAEFGLSGGVSVLQGGRYHGAQETANEAPREAVDDAAIPLTSETQKAIDAVRFIAAHLKNEDDYAEVCLI